VILSETFFAVNLISDLARDRWWPSPLCAFFVARVIQDFHVRVKVGHGALSVSTAVAEAGCGVGGARRRWGRCHLAEWWINEGGGSGPLIMLGFQDLRQQLWRGNSGKLLQDGGRGGRRDLTVGGGAAGQGNRGASLAVGPALGRGPPGRTPGLPKPWGPLIH
jgi:hypothetical protein